MPTPIILQNMVKKIISYRKYFCCSCIINECLQHTTHISIFLLFILLAGAQVRTLNFKKWFGSGILHTKMWLIDRKHFYVGSANLDWRSLTQVGSLSNPLDTNTRYIKITSVSYTFVYWYRFRLLVSEQYFFCVKVMYNHHMHC